MTCVKSVDAFVEEAKKKRVIFREIFVHIRLEL